MVRMVLLKDIIPKRLAAGQVIQNPDGNPPEYLVGCPKCGANGRVVDDGEIAVEIHELIPGARGARNISISPQMVCPYCDAEFRAVDGNVEFLDGAQK